MPYVDITLAKKLTLEEKTDLGKFMDGLIKKLPGKAQTDSTIFIKDDVFHYNRNTDSSLHVELLQVKELPLDDKDAFVKSITAYAAEMLGITNADHVSVNIQELYSWGAHDKYIMIEKP